MEKASDIFSNFPSSRTENKNKKQQLSSPLQISINDSSVLNLDSNSRVLMLSIYQFKPAWSIQAYLRFSNIPYRVINLNFPIKEPTGKLPQLHDGHFIVPGLHAIDHIKKVHKNIDSFLPESHVSDVEAYCAFALSKISEVLEFLNCAENNAVASLVTKVIPFPLNVVFQKVEKFNVSAKLWIHGIENRSLNEVIDVAESCFITLENKLQNGQPFFFGDIPSSVDAVVFGLLAEAMNHTHLITLLTKFEKLSFLFTTVCEKFFPSDDVLWTPILRIVYQRADFVNSKNQFNQLHRSCLTFASNYAVDLFDNRMNVTALQSSLEEYSSAVQSEQNKRAAAIPSEKEETLSNENRRWYAIVGVSLLSFLLYRNELFAR